MGAPHYSVRMSEATLRNYAIFLSLVVAAPLLVTLVIGYRSISSLITFMIILDIVVAVAMAFTYLYYVRLARRYYARVLDFYTGTPRDTASARVAVLVLSYNEDPLTVAQNALVASLTVGPENVFVLDDSTDQAIVTRLQLIAERTGFNYVHRAERRGYKAGAINDWLRTWGRNYEYAVILDADQMLLPGVIGRLLSYFDDESVAFVQVPQYYSNTRTWIGVASWIQQLPFLRVVMRARDMRGSPFILGSGTVFRVRPVLEVGGFNEETVTEDIYTSLELLERGYIGRYIDVPALWSGEPPQSYLAYWVQQSRWSLGGFQLLPRLLRAKIGTVQFWDYLDGVIYWLKVSLLALAEVIAPVLFLIFNVYYFRYAQLYFLIYIPFVLFMLYSYVMSMRNYNYGFRAFLAHYSLQSIDSFPTSLSFFTWALGRRRPFRVTPKGGGQRTPLRLMAPTLIVVSVLAISLGVGVYKLMAAVSFPYRLGVMVNVFWVAWLLVGYSIGLLLIVGGEAPFEVRKAWRQRYSPELFEVGPIVHYAVQLEREIADYDGSLSRAIGEEAQSAILAESSEESLRHAEIYGSIAENLGVSKWSFYSPVLSSFLDAIRARIKDARARCLNRRPVEDPSCFLIEEELMMRVVAQLVTEVLHDRLSEDMVRQLESLADDEVEHFYTKLHLVYAVKGEGDSVPALPITRETKSST